MHYTCRWCDYEREEPHMTRDIMREIFDHEKSHPENKIKPDPDHPEDDS
jgi:hypothetical protein